jgi:hypothetical protein
MPSLSLLGSDDDDDDDLSIKAEQSNSADKTMKTKI